MSQKLETSNILEIANLLIAGKVGVMPTDTVYGLHCLADNLDAIRKIYTLKKRPDTIPFITLIYNEIDLVSFGVKVDNLAFSQIEKLWPGPNTLIFDIAGKQSKSFRIPNNMFLTTLLQKTGPLISTSANVNGEPVAKNIKQAISYFGDSVDFYVEGGEISNLPSKVYKIQGNELIVIR